MTRIAFIAILTALSFTSPAGAQPCKGRYEDAASLVDRAYTPRGTLYSAGPSYSTGAFTSVGPTLEIYRLLMGLPDAGMSTPRPRDAEFVDPPVYPGAHLDARDTFIRSLPRLHDPSFRRDRPEGSTDVEVLLNVYTTLGPYPGWWLDPDNPQLTPMQKVIASFAVDDGLDWLQTTLSASAQPHTLSWTLYNNDFRYPQVAALQRLYIHSLERYAATESLPWFVAAFLTQEQRPYATLGIEASQGAIRARFSQMTEGVADCSATPAEYVAFAIATFETARISRRESIALDQAMLLPRSLRLIMATQLAKFRPPYWRQTDAIPPDQLRALADDPSFDQWQAVGLSYRAMSVEELIEINAGIPFDPKLSRLLNILSADDLIRMADSRDGFEREQRDLLTAALLRLFALERDEDAAALVDRILPLWPDHDLAAIWNGPGALGYRLAKLALALPDARTHVAPHIEDWSDQGAFEENFQTDIELRSWALWLRGRDLSFDLRSGGFLRRDYRYWMRTVGSAPDAHVRALTRAYRRQAPIPDFDSPFFPMRERSGWNSRRAGPEVYGAWAELTQLGPETGLANRIGRELILNARDHLDGPFFGLFADKDALAQDMATIIWQGRHMIQGEMEGRPLGQVAFQILHGPLANTETAAETPYWYVCRERCRP